METHFAFDYTRPWLFKIKTALLYTVYGKTIKEKNKIK